MPINEAGSETKISKIIEKVEQRKFVRVSKIKKIVFARRSFLYFCGNFENKTAEAAGVIEITNVIKIVKTINGEFERVSEIYFEDGEIGSKTAKTTNIN